MTSPSPDFAAAASVVADPLHFKAQLGIGENAYAALRLRKAAFEAWDAAGAAATGAAVAASPAVATTFFGATGFWAALGLGGAAVTPVGWVILAGALSGGAWFGLSRALRGAGQDRVTVIPHIINTPMDVLALALFELMAPLALKVAAVDGAVGAAERRAIRDWFVRDWGYDAAFADEALGWTEARLDGFSIKALATGLAAFKRDNPDCDADAMARTILAFLRQVAEADGPLDEREEMAIERIAAAFAAEGRFSLRRAAGRLAARVAGAFRRGGGRRIP
jgi:tellurite resistance protein